MQKYGVSQRRCCKALSISRSLVRYIKRNSDDEDLLRAAIIDLATKHGRYGYKKITSMLHCDGWRVNHKRVMRIWREEGLKVPKKQPKKKRLYLDDGSCVRLKPCYENHVWSYDFVSDRLENGRKYRMLTVIDEFTRKCLMIKVDYKLNSDNVIDALSDLFLTHGLPDYIRSDNGSEFTARILQNWLEKLKVKTAYITPGSPWENGYNERFNGTLRGELLNGEIFENLHQAKVIIEDWRVEYNTIRPHKSLGYRPPSPVVICKNNPPQRVEVPDYFCKQITNSDMDHNLGA